MAARGRAEGRNSQGVDVVGENEIRLGYTVTFLLIRVIHITPFVGLTSLYVTTVMS